MDLMIKLLKSNKMEPLQLKIPMETLSSLTMLKKVIFGECVKLNKIQLKIGFYLQSIEQEHLNHQQYSG